MLYYLGKGTEFKKEDCKEYKTIEGALKAAAKNEELVVWDENGNVIGSLTDNVPEGALETNPDGSVNTYNADGNKVGTMTAEELKAATTLTDEKDAEGQQGNAGASTDDENGGTGGNTPVEPENGQNGANSEQENGQQTSGDGDDAPGICSDHGGAAVALETEPSVLRALWGKDGGQQDRAGARLPGLRSDGISKDLPGSHRGDHERGQTSYVALPRQPQYLPWICADRWICRDRGDI